MQIVRKTEHLLSNTVGDEENQLNLIFYIALYATAIAINNSHVPSKEVMKLDLNSFDDNLIGDCWLEVSEVYSEFGGDDKAAKSADMRNAIIARLEHRIHGD